MSKALDLDTRLPTPSGWTTMGQVQSGDRLFDDRGEPCIVLGISPIMIGNTCYRVDFCDGSSINADAGHLWTVMRAYKIPTGFDRRVETLTTQDMVDRGLSMSNGAARFAIPLASPLRCEPNSLPVDPYVLGAWLGDGNARCAALTVGDQDLAETLELLGARGVATSVVRERTANRVSLFHVDDEGVRLARGAPSNLQRQLRAIGVLGNKHIPISYLRASELDRWSLLRGLMDTDGTPGGGTCRFTVVSSALANGVFELAASLGLRPRHRTREINGGTYFQVEFRAYRDQPVFGLDRKQAQLPIEQASSRRHLNRQRYVRAIVPIVSRPVRCIAVSSASNLFLAGEAMIPTHNTELALDVMGKKLDTEPVPMAFVAPSRDLLEKTISPRVDALFAQSKSLRGKLQKGRMAKTRRVVAGVPLRLVHAGSATALASENFALVVSDEVDKLLLNVKGQGDPIGQADRRGDSYPGFVHFATSSPSVGVVDTVVDEESGLEFWAEQDPVEIQSTIWRMWQAGTRHHWAWPCPHCGSFFIPRFKHLSWEKPKDREGRELPSDALMARRTCVMICPENGCVIDDEDKEIMNARGVYVTPGQSVQADGTVAGPEREAWTLSYWVSGLASPFVPWGQRAAEFVEAARSGVSTNVQAVINGFGELFSPGDGEAPEWAELASLRRDYRIDTIPPWCRVLTMTADVQKDRIYYVIRGWGQAESSALIRAGELFGSTESMDVWNDLRTVLLDSYDGMPIRLCLVDSGYRPGKKHKVPEHMVYRFCRQFPKLAIPTKGASNPMRKPLAKSAVDVNIDGKLFKRGIEIRILDTGFFKRWVHQKIRWPQSSAEAIDDGGWYLPDDVTDDYLMQMTSEAEITLASGKTKWVARSKQNHFWDCETMHAAAAMMLNLKLLRAGPPMRAAPHAPRKQRAARPVERKVETEAAEEESPSESLWGKRPSQAAEAPPPKRRRSRPAAKRESVW